MSTSFVPVDSTVFVTGINGLLGSVVAHDLLTSGYRVRGAVRSQAKGDALRAHLPTALHSALTFVIVPDITAPTAYDAPGVLDGVTAVAHVASPVPATMETEDPAAMIDTAVQSTINLLLSASKHPSIRRVLYVSSTATISLPGEMPATGQQWTEANWSSITREAAYATKSAFVAYSASKTFAERAAWSFVNAESRMFDLVTIIPPALFGPSYITVSRPSDLPSSAGVFHRILQGGPGMGSGSFVDIRDLAAVITRALQVEAAGGERFLVGAGVYTNAEIASLNVGDGEESGVGVQKFDSGKASRVLRFKPRDKWVTLRDMKRWIDDALAVGNKA